MLYQFDLIVFDWDGTLMDSAARIVASLQAAADELELPRLEDQQLRNIIGLGMREAIHSLYPDIDELQTNQFINHYRHHFLVACPLPEKLFAGVLPVLEKLTAQQRWLGVATGKSRKGLDRVLADTDCLRYFHSTRCADETCSKPNPQMLLEIIDEVGTTADKTLMVGDTEYDMEMAQRAGTAALAVSYGAHEIHRLQKYQPLALIDSVQQMDDWFERNLPV